MSSPRDEEHVPEERINLSRSDGMHSDIGAFLKKPAGAGGSGNSSGRNSVSPKPEIASLATCRQLKNNKRRPSVPDTDDEAGAAAGAGAGAAAVSDAGSGSSDKAGGNDSAATTIVPDTPSGDGPIRLARSDAVTHDILQLGKDFSKKGGFDFTDAGSGSGSGSGSREGGGGSLKGLRKAMRSLSFSARSSTAAFFGSRARAVTDRGEQAAKDCEHGSAAGASSSNSSEVTFSLPGDSSSGAANMSSSADAPAQSVRVVHFSDTHNFLFGRQMHPATPRKNSVDGSSGSACSRGAGRGAFSTRFLPRGDVMIHSGDFSAQGTDEEFAQFDAWLDAVSTVYPVRIVVLGRHDVRRYGTDWEIMKSLLPHATHVLCHEEVTVCGGLRVYGIPWHWGVKKNLSLNLSLMMPLTNPRGEPGKRGFGSGQAMSSATAEAPLPPSLTTKSAKEADQIVNHESVSFRMQDVPMDGGLHILVTHGPAFGRCDRIRGEDDHSGNKELAACVLRCRPNVHLHGMVHEANGYQPAIGGEMRTMTVNSAMAAHDSSVMCHAPQVVRCAPVRVPGVEVCDCNWVCTIDGLE